jgi:hypothetical protein
VCVCFTTSTPVCGFQANRHSLEQRWRPCIERTPAASPAPCSSYRTSYLALLSLLDDDGPLGIFVRELQGWGKEREGKCPVGSCCGH